MIAKIISEKHRISIASILSRPRSFSIRLTFEPIHPSLRRPWIFQNSQISDDQKFRFALLDKGRTCTFVFRNTATSGRVPSYYHLVYSHRRSKNRMAIFFRVNFHDLKFHMRIFSGRFPRVSGRFPRVLLALC